VGASRIDLGQPLVDRGQHLEPGDLGHARLVEQAEREEQVGVGIGVDPMPGQRGGQAQAGSDTPGELGEDVDSRADQLVRQGRRGHHGRGR
jgi:hypothetical protein